MQRKISRRNWMAGSAALSAAAASGQLARAQSKKPVVISSFNGLAACKKAMEMLRGGADTLDAVIAGVNILELETLPRHLIVVGGSYVGLEFAQIFRRFGSEVTIIEKSSRLVSREDEDVSASIKAFLEV